MSQAKMLQEDEALAETELFRP